MRRESVKRSLISAVLVLALAAILAFWPTSKPAASASPDHGEQEHNGIEVATVATSQEIVRATHESRVGSILVTDELSGDKLDIPVQLLLNGVDPIQLATGQTIQLPHLGAYSALRYQLLDGSEYEVPAAGRVVQESDTWAIRIPFTCRVLVNVAEDRRAFIDSQTEIYVLRHPKSALRDESIDPASIEALWQAQLNDTTFRGLMNRAIRKESIFLLKVRCTDRTIPPATVSAQGDSVIGLGLADGTTAYAPTTLTPGVEIEVFVDLVLRPLLTGVLLDWNGAPVPDEEVTFSSALDMLDWDFSPRDAAGVVALRVDGVLYQVTKNSAKTDADGRFSMRVPRGRDYCVESNAKGGHAFWNTRDAGIVVTDGAEIELRLTNPESESAILFSVLRPDGLPFAGVDAVVAVGNDLPFIRQFPKKPTDSEGKVRFLGLDPGELCSLIIYDPSLQRSMFGSGRIVVPTDRRVTVVVPLSAFKDG